MRFSLSTNLPFLAKNSDCRQKNLNLRWFLYWFYVYIEKILPSSLSEATFRVHFPRLISKATFRGYFPRPLSETSFLHQVFNKLILDHWTAWCWFALIILAIDSYARGHAANYFGLVYHCFEKTNRFDSLVTRVIMIDIFFFLSDCVPSINHSTKDF